MTAGTDVPPVRPGRPALRPRRHHVDCWVSSLAAPAVILALAGLALLPLVQDQLNADGVSYLSIAEHYLAGRWGEAVNGYWSPLLSWLVAPLLALDIRPTVALKLLSLLVAVAALVATDSLVALAGVSPRTRAFLRWLLVPFLLYAAVLATTPDLLVAVLLLRFCRQTCALDFATNRGRWVSAGAWAGLAVLAKLYALPFVLVFLGVTVALHSWLGAGRPTLRVLGPAVVSTLAVLAVMAGAWAVVLSAKYDRPTLGTSAGYNVEVSEPGSAGNPVRRGLNPPPGPNAVSAWEEPSLLPPPAKVDLGPGRSPDSRLTSAVENTVRAGALVGRRFGVVALLAVVGVVLLARRRRPGVLLPGLVAAVAIYGGGLTLVVVQERYLWFVMLAAVPLAAVAVDAVRSRSGPVRRRLLAAVALLLVAAPAAAGIGNALHANRDLVRLVATAEAGVLQGRIASDQEWRRSAHVCFLAGCRYYGTTSETGPALADVLSAQGIERYLSWNPAGQVNEPFLRPLATFPEDNVVVYAVELEGR